MIAYSLCHVLLNRSKNWLTFSSLDPAVALGSEQSTGSLRVESQRRRLRAHGQGGSGSHDQFFCNAVAAALLFLLRSSPKSLENSSDRAVLCTLSFKGEQKSQVISTKSKSELYCRRLYRGKFFINLKRPSNGQICDTLDLFPFSDL